MSDMTDREKIEKIAAEYRNLTQLRIQQHRTMAELVRVCVARLKSPDSRKRREAIDALVGLADMLEGVNTNTEKKED